MGVILRDYQDDVIHRGRQSMRHNRRVLFQLPTGGGKTAIASFMTDQAQARDKIVYFVCHRAELLTQTSATFRRFGIAHSFIAAGLRYEPHLNVQICSIDTLKNRTHIVPEPDLCIWDECHHIVAAGWAAVMNEWGKAFHIGLSATPIRTDGKGLDDLFDEIVLGPTVAWLIEQGHLSPYQAFIPSGGMDVTGVHKRMGDFVGKEIEAKIDRPKLVGDIIQHWRKHASGALSIAFAPSLDFSMYMVDQFNAAGIPAAHLDGGTDKAERKRIIQRFADGGIRVLWNRFLFGEGLDLAAIAQKDVTIDCVIDAAPTQSVALALQRWGRALRPGEGKTAILLDHAGNMLRHGFPDDEREWSLEGEEKTGRGGASTSQPPMICGDCYNAIKRPAPTHCPHCGKALKPEAKPLEVGDGELVAANDNEKAAVRAQLKKEENDAKDLGELVALAQRRGYKNPMHWAQRKYGGSKWRQKLAEG